MDIRDFSNKLAEATKDMSPEERNALKSMFENVTKEMEAKGSAPAPVASAAPGTDVPDGPTPRIKALKDNYNHAFTKYIYMPLWKFISYH